jgi:Putative DNA-binding domain
VRAPLEEVMRALSGAFRSGAPLPDDPALAALCGEHVAGNERLTPAEQADIYRRQFWLRHLDALREDYPGLECVLGEDDFEAFCRAYLAAHPPASFTLRDLGSEVVRFARGYDGFPDDRRALARDMARYEHVLVELFDGAAPPPLDPAKVTGMPEDGWSTARIVLHPLFVRMRLDHPVHEVRAALKRGEQPAPPAPRPVHLAVFRTDLVIRYEELDPVAFALLEELGRGVPLVPACEVVAAGFNEAAGADEAAGAALTARFGDWFSQWTRWGLLVDVVR